MHHLTMNHVADTYQFLQELESIRLLKDSIESHEGYEKWFERYSAALILRFAFGKVVVTEEEEYVRRILGLVHFVERVVEGDAHHVLKILLIFASEESLQINARNFGLVA